MLINISALLIINEFDNLMGKIFIMHLKSFHLEITLSECFLIFDKVEPSHYQQAYFVCMTMLVDFCIYSAVSIPVHKNQCDDYDTFYEQEYMRGVFIGYRPGGVYMALNMT